MRTTLIGRWLEKNHKSLVALLAAGAMLATATLIDASSSSQVEQLGPLVVPRTGHAATALADGRVLITGGRDSAGIIVATAEVFDPANQISTAIGVLNTARIDHTATLLADGRVLIAGGTSASGALTSAEIFDPVNPGTGFRVLSSTMSAARGRHTATRLHDGTVLIAGGDAAGTAEIFNPTTETFSSTLLAMAAPRIGHTATLFSDDSVLLAGGNTDSMEYFSSVGQTFTLDPQKMTAVRTGQEAIALDDTRLLFFGGDTGNTIDEFNSSADAITPKGTMDAAASSATLLANGKILVLRPDVAGLYAPDATDVASAFTPFDETSVPGSTALHRNGQSATELSSDKKIFVAGGVDTNNQVIPQSALFNPARIWSDKDDYQPTDPVILSGSGWKANENIYLFAVDSETDQWTYESTIPADGNGEFSVDPYFIVQLRQLGTLFHVTAMGAQSSMQAEVEFTDAVNLNSITVGAQTGAAVAAVASSVTYQITASYTGSGTNNDDPVSLSFLGWTGATPAGVTTSFSPTTVTKGSPNSTLTLQTSSSTIVAGTYTFTVRGTTAGGQHKDGTGTLTIAPGAATKLALSGSTTNLASGSTRVLTATIQDANGNTVTSGPNSTLSVMFAKTGGAGTVTGLGATNAVGGVATLTVTGNQLGSVTISASATGSGGALAAGAGNPITFNVVAGAANKLLLSGSTADLAAGATRQLSATIQDVNGNTITTGADSILSVTFAKTAGNGTVTGLGSAIASAGVATLTVTGNQPGAITITASATGSAGALTPGPGNPITFNVVTGAASKIALSGSTANLTAGSTRTLTATIQDSAGNTITTGGDSTLSVTFAKTTGTGSVTGVGSVNAVAGVVNITVTGATAGSVTIGASGTASDGALAAGSGNPITFTVVASTTVDHFAFATISSPQTAGSPFNITITAQDAGNNTVTGYSGNGFKVKLTSTGTLVGAPVTTPAFTNGVLANQSVTITNTGNFTITATDNGGGTATGTGNSFQVNAGAASKLAFIQQPTTTTAGQTIAPAVTVQIQDVNGNVTASTASVAIAIANNPSSGTLSGITPVTAVNGVATFNDLSINKGGTGYTLQATSAGLTSATSSAFNINNPAPTLTNISPTSGNLSQTLDVVFNGTNYIQGVSSVSFADANITVNSVTVNSSIKLTANITIGSGATVGLHNVSVTNAAPGGGTATLNNAFTVNNPATTTTVTSSLNPSNYGDSVTFTATVTTASGTPTGNVTFYDSATCSGTVLAGPTNLDANGKASFTTTSLTVPGHTITACYTPTGVFQPSNGSVTQTVNKAHLTVKADDKSTTYDGNAFTALTATITGFVNSETASVVSGSASFTTTPATPVNAGTYTIAPVVGTLSASNYDFPPANFQNGTLTIGKANATWTTNPNSKTYGDADPNPLTTGSGSGFVAADNITATYTRAAGERVAGGPYHITATLSPAAALGNYNITNAGANFTIGKRAATWTTSDNSKIYGNADPNPLTTGSGSNFVAADGITATYSRAPGETVAGGPYHITATLSPAAALDNYNVTNDGADFSISKRDATWTTNNASKTYGNPDPDPLTTGSGTNFIAADNVTATYSRAAGETVLGGPYHISATLAPAAVLSNYKITNAGADFTINARPATWTTNPNSKTYGDTDPSPLTTGSGSGFLNSDNVTATYTRAPGETVAGGPYHITAVLSPAGVLSNYDITNAGADFTINKRDATWTTNPNSKTYGDADPTPLTTGSGTNFVPADNVTASYSRVAGETVAGGPYHITATLSPAAVLANYYVTNTGADFTINKRNATWTTDPNSKTYGDVDPTPLTTGSGSNFVDTITATYSRAAGETVAGGPYHITATLSPAAVLDNYILTNTGADFTINKRNATWTTDPNSKTYGDLDPAPLTTGSGSNFVDPVSATYSRAPGETVAGGPYHITAMLSSTPVSALDNYNVTNTGADFTINKRNATWTTNPNSKTYGDADPSPVTTGSGTNFVDTVTATYSRDSGETVAGGPYHITATLSSTPASALDNYNVTNSGADFTINKRSATWTTNPNSKIYGEADPNPITTGSGSNFVVADNVTATYSRVASETVLGGPYHITATLSPAGVLGNYDITNAGASFTINTRPATWITSDNSKTYGDADPNPLTTGSAVALGPGTGFLAADSVTATYTRVAGETVLGGPYHITANLAPVGVLSNYTITNAGASFTITTRPATWTTKPSSKTYGDMDPSPLTTGSGGNFVAADNVTATYSRTAGETVLGGPYHITANLGPAAVLSNYSITNAGADFVINPRPATVKADNKAKTYGDDNPTLTATITGTVNGDILNYSLATTAVKFSNVGNYTITVTLGSNPNYSITPTNGTLTINKANQTITWANPANVIVGTPLSGTQLNATVAGVTGGSAPGALTYTPPAGTVLGVGANQTLRVDAAATINYNTATKTVSINVNYTFVGFLQPIDNLPTINSTKAGQTIPIKWQLKDASGNLISDLGSLAQNGLTSGSVACGSAPVDVVEELSAPGSTVFRFDGTQFIYNWQTSKSWAGGCRTLQVRLSDGTSYYAQFTFK